MRPAFRIALACGALLALHRRGVLGNELASAPVGRVQRELPGEAGEACGAISPYEILPFP